MTMIAYDPSNPNHRKQAAANIKAAWAMELMRGSSPVQGGAPDNAAQMAAKYAQQWADAGLDPNAPGAPVAAEGVEPLAAPEPTPAPEPTAWTGPSLAEIDAELAEQDRNVTSIERIRALRIERAAAVRAGVKE
jgi:hypothetical protein